MSFLTDLISCMTSDASVNSYATGGIVYEHLPIDFSSDKDWIVFGFTSEGNIDVLTTKNVLSNYILNIQIVSPSITNLTTISDRLITYLLNYKSGGIGDINLSDDDLNINTEKNVYYKTLNFNVLFIN